MAMVDTVYWLPIGGPAVPADWLGPKGRRPPGAVNVFITWTEWTLAMALPWWQHYKYRRGYYYYVQQKKYSLTCVLTGMPYKNSVYVRRQIVVLGWKKIWKKPGRGCRRENEHWGSQSVLWHT